MDENVGVTWLCAGKVSSIHSFGENQQCRLHLSGSLLIACGICTTIVLSCKLCNLQRDSACGPVSLK